MHLLRLSAYCNCFVGSSVSGNNGGFIHHYFVIVNNQRIGRAEVNSDFLCKKIEQTHVSFACCAFF
jgi:hypothetical protein